MRLKDAQFKVMSFTRLTYHIVFATKNRQPLITSTVEREVYSFIYTLCKNKNAFVRRINGMADHIHLLVDIPSTISVSDFVQYIKSQSSNDIKARSLIRGWQGWVEGYAGFTVCYGCIERVYMYILHQKEHHKKVSFIEEYKQFLIDHGIDSSDPWFPK